MTVSLVLVPSAGGVTLAIAGAFGAYGPPAAVVNVLVADHALAPTRFEPWTCTSIAAPAARSDRSYGLVTPATIVHVPAPEGLDRTLNPAAAPCVLSTAGAIQVTVRSLPAPCASDSALGVFGANGPAVVSVLVADHALVPAVFELWSCTSIAAPVARPDRVYGLVTPDTIVQVPAAGRAGSQVDPGGGAVCAVDRRGGPDHSEVAAAALCQ